jgi:hypothetical protein
MSAAGLWLTVALSGAYHGLNPAMGWPLAVSAALMNGGRRALAAALGLLALGHLGAMAVILLPFALLASLVQWQQAIRIAAGLLVIGFGVWLLARRGRHPRMLARIRPSQLALWSFAVALAHGAGLMLAPIYLGLCNARAASPGHQAASRLIEGSLPTALLVALAHTAAMVCAGGAIALSVHAWLGMRFLSRAWFNLDSLWAASLVAVGAVALGYAAAAAG